MNKWPHLRKHNRWRTMLEDNVSDYDGSALALAGASRRGHVGSL
jgi:hypothetical protein